MSVDKKIIQTNGVIIVDVDVTLSKVFSEYFSEIIKELCYQHLAKGMAENLEPQVIEENANEDAIKGVKVALAKKIRETFIEIVKTGEENIMAEIKERLGKNA